MFGHNPIQCIIPPYITEHRARSVDPKVRSRAVADLGAGVRMRTLRQSAQSMPSLMASISPTQARHRLVHDARRTNQLPGKLARSEGQRRVSDPAVNEAYDYAGKTYDFYDQVFNRNSLDNRGMTLISSVHVAEVDDSGKYVPMDNAFWDGRQMAYGDGDGAVFQRFTKAVEVVGHELTHGVESFTSNLNYYGQSGALNEHMADVFGVLVRQWSKGETVARTSWLIGADLLVPAATRRAIRDMEHPGTAFANDPDLGSDPQPDHMSKIYTGRADNGGVHINSGIPNRAFVLTARTLGGKAWGVPGRIWYDTMIELTVSSQFQDCADLTYKNAGAHGSGARKAVKNAWKKVGIKV